MAQQGPNPIELYEGAVQAMLPILRGVQQGQLSTATPCTEWNVQQLIKHNILVAQFFNSLLTSGEAVDPFAVGGDLPEEGAQDAFVAGTNKVLEVIKTPGLLEKMLDETPFGPMTAGQLLMFPFGDILIHKWDLAKATGQDTAMDSSMADVVYKIYGPMMEGMREHGLFGTEVAVPANASDRDKLLGLCGRTP